VGAPECLWQLRLGGEQWLWVAGVDRPSASRRSRGAGERPCGTHGDWQNPGPWWPGRAVATSARRSGGGDRCGRQRRRAPAWSRRRNDGAVEHLLG
jgi:hypothetical protein